MVIQHNISAINSLRNTKLNNNGVSKNLEKLSSGSRINRAADDAAGLAISEKMRGQIRGTMMGTQNVNMGINLVQTAEGGLNETHSILQRMRELAVQSANGTYQDDDRALINKEYQALKSEVDRIANTTKYNDIPLLNVPRSGIIEGSTEKVESARELIRASFETVTESGGTNDQIKDMFAEFSALTPPFDLPTLKDIAGRLSSTVEIANDAFESVIKTVNGLIDEYGNDAFNAPLLDSYIHNREFHYDDKAHYINFYLGPIRAGTADALATADPDTAHARLTTAFARAWGGGGAIVACHAPVANAAWALLENVNVSAKEIRLENALWIQSGANRGNGMYVSLCDARSPALGIDKTALDPIEAANEAISLLDDATNIISSYRADFGASQNRLESAARNNGATAENLQAAESSIRDLDMAKEMMGFTKNNILIQASQSMLAQANQLPQGVLSLLR